MDNVQRARVETQNEARGVCGGNRQSRLARTSGLASGLPSESDAGQSPASVACPARLQASSSRCDGRRSPAGHLGAAGTETSRHSIAFSGSRQLGKAVASAFSADREVSTCESNALSTSSDGEEQAGEARCDAGRRGQANESQVRAATTLAAARAPSDKAVYKTVQTTRQRTREADHCASAISSPTTTRTTVVGAESSA